MLRRLMGWLRFTWLYLGRPPWDTGVSPPELLEFIQQHPPGRAMDLGCGTGTNLLTLASAGWQVSGVDFALQAVAAARRKLAAAGFHGDVRAGDVTHLEVVRGVYNLVLDIGCYHSLPEPGRAAYRGNLLSILARGGTFLLYAHFVDPVTKAPSGIYEADLLAFQAVLDLEDRQDSLDNRGRAAVWARYRARNEA
jgi:SAM-dependent methyltransferase